MIGPTIPLPSEIDAAKIIRPAYDELSDDQRKTFEAMKDQRIEQIEELRKKKEKELLDEIQ